MFQSSVFDWSWATPRVPTTAERRAAPPRRGPCPPSARLALPRDKDWTAISNADAAYNPPTGHIRQPAWAPGNQAGHYLPGWFKAAVTPSDSAYGWRKGDIIVAVNGEIPKGLPDFYRKIYAQGSAGAVIPLDMIKNNERQHIEIKSINRLDHLRLKSSF